MTGEFTHKSMVNDALSSIENEKESVDSYQAIKSDENSYHDIKMQIGGRISKILHQRFKDYVLWKHGKLNGVYSAEIELALEHYLEISHTQQHTTSSNNFLSNSDNSKGMRRDKLAKLQAIASALQEFDSFPIFNAKTLQATISRVLGKVDSRTFNSYREELKKHSVEEQAPNGFSSIIDVTKFMVEFGSGTSI